MIDEDTHHGLVAYLNDPSRISKTGFERRYQGIGVYRCGVCGALVSWKVQRFPRLRLPVDVTSAARAKPWTPTSTPSSSAASPSQTH